MTAKESEINSLLIEYKNILEKLKNLGVIRTSKVVGDYGEYIAAKKLNLKLSENSVNKGYDATDQDNKKYEIKARKATSTNIPTIFPINSKQISVIDFLVYVEFSNEWIVVKILKIPKKEIKANKHNRVCVTQELVKKYNILNKNK